MPDRYDPKVSVRPLERAETALEASARTTIRWSNWPGSCPAGRPVDPPPAEAKAGFRRSDAAAGDDVARDLEAELLNDLQASFRGHSRAAAAPPPPHADTGAQPCADWHRPRRRVPSRRDACARRAAQPTPGAGTLRPAAAARQAPAPRRPRRGSARAPSEAPLPALARGHRSRRRPPMFRRASPTTAPRKAGTTVPRATARRAGAAGAAASAAACAGCRQADRWFRPAEPAARSDRANLRPCTRPPAPPKPAPPSRRFAPGRPAETAGSPSRRSVASRFAPPRAAARTPRRRRHRRRSARRSRSGRR